MVSGVPVVFEGLAQELSTQIFILLAAALAAMVITLAAVFRSPLRLLPLAIALGATGIVFGFLSLAGGSLTMASIAVLPVLIGLSVDYAIQFQARFVEAVRAGSSPPRAAVEAAARGGPVIATAGLATVAGFAVLVLSPIPMVRGFALLLVLGIVVAFALALTVGLSALSLLSTQRVLEAPPEDPAPARVRLAGVRGPRAVRFAPHPAWGRPSFGRMPRSREPRRACAGRARRSAHGAGRQAGAPSPSRSRPPAESSRSPPWWRSSGGVWGPGSR